jgi:lipoprotein-anchoring transpeptidase ErfK/SrfK
MKRIFLIILPLAVVFAGGVLYFSTRSASWWTNPSCGCGPLPVEATGEYEETTQAAIFNNEPVTARMTQLMPNAEALALQEGAILGATTDERWIEIDLSKQRLYAHNGDKIDYEFLVSSGKWAPTPTGEFRIWSKFRYTKMSGGNKALHTNYYLPNVPYTQYFSKDVGLHGTYWHNNFGHPMSHGCVNLATPDAEKLFYWTSPPLSQGENSAYPTKDAPGTKVVVHQ